MQVHTIEDAKNIAGKTFERDGLRRTVTRVNDVHICGVSILGYVYWKRPGGKECGAPKCLPIFNAWLTGADEVDPEPTT